MLLGVLAGLAAGLAIAAIDGADRSGTAYERMRSRLAGTDAVFFPSQAGVGDADVTKLSDIPEVAAWGGFASTASEIDEIPGGGPLVQVGSDWFTSIEGARVLEGRLPDPGRDDEAVINLPAAAEGGQIGLVLTWRNLSPADRAAFGGGYPPDGWDWKQATGPVTRLRIVGIVRQPMESVLSFASGPTIWVGSGWAKAHLSSTAVDFTNAVVRLRHGAADVPAFEAGVARVYGRTDLPVKDLSDDIKRVQRSLDVERTALLLFGAAVIVATVVLIGQAIVRSVRSVSEGAPVLRALGLGRRGLLAGLMAPQIVVVAMAAVAAPAIAIALSSQFPVGLGRQLDPEVGTRVNWFALVVGAVVTVAAAAVLCCVVALRTIRRLTPGRRAPRGELIGTATRAGASVPAAVGASMALEPTARRAGATARPALLTAVVGVLGIVAAVTLVGGIDDMQQRPERIGRTWDVEGTPEVTADALDGFIAGVTTTMAGDHDIAAFALMSRTATVVAGKGDVPLYSLRDPVGSMSFTILRGRAPGGDAEVAIGPRTASAIGAHIGDTIAVGPSSSLMKVVGISLLAQTPHTSFDEGVWMTPAALDTTTGTAWQARELTVLVRVRDGASTAAVQGALNGMGLFTAPLIVPPDVANLANVRTLPLFLAAFLILLAIGATAHALLTGARSRSHDLAALRALGLTPRQAAACVIWQAAIIGVVALAVGIPIGVVVGRQVWRLLADSLSFVYVGPVAGLVLVLIAPIALAVIGLMAAWPARSAARLHTAEVLRTE